MLYMSDIWNGEMIIDNDIISKEDHNVILTVTMIIIQ